MSKQAPAWFAPWYSDKVIYELKNRGFRLKGTTTEATGIKANDAYWRVAKAVAAILYQRGNIAKPAGGGRNTVTVSMETWQVYEEIFDDDLEKMTVNEKEVVARTGGDALGRTFDQQIIDALNLDAAAAVVTDVTNGMSLVNALLMCDAAQSQTDGLWDGNWYCPLPSRLWNQLLAYKQFNNGDYTGADLAFTKVTDRRTWNGVHWFLAPNSWFPVPAGSQVDTFLWHKDAVGYASNYEPKTDIAWEQPLTAWTSNMRMAGKAKVLLPEGVVRARFKSDATITPN